MDMHAPGQILSELAFLGPHSALIVWIAAGLLAYLVGAKILTPVIKRFAAFTTWTWDDILIRNGAAKSLSTIVVAVIMMMTRPLAGEIPPVWNTFVTKGLNLLFILSFYMLLVQILRTVHMSYEERKSGANLPIKTLTQAVTVILSILTLILVIALLTDKNPVHILSGLGALTAVMMLVFKDSLLGLVAGIQLSANDLVRKNDWIEMPSRHVDGVVIDITLTTVRVQNWDKTISAIPAYDLVSSSFKNWRGMAESGGRRIKRAINIDMGSIRFLKKEEIESLRSVHLLRDYIDARSAEIEKYNSEHFDPNELSMPVNGRHMTNVGTFRAYVSAYLRAHPEIHADAPGMTFLIRQLEPGPKGLPLEIYVFTKTTEWIRYEGVQSDIFDHLLSTLPWFYLRAFQEPTGADMAQALAAKEFRKAP
jgi:miniconductance mechanosensitive channel